MYLKIQSNLNPSSSKKFHKLTCYQNQKGLDIDFSLKGKEIKSTYHNSSGMNPEKGTKNIPEGDPRLYFDAYAIKVVPLMRNTQKTYKSKGGLVVDMFKPIRYN